MNIGARPERWTLQQIKTLAEFWSTGLTAREIGAKLGFSVGAIMGKIHRLGLCDRREKTRLKSINQALINKNSSRVRFS